MVKDIFAQAKAETKRKAQKKTMADKTKSKPGKFLQHLHELQYTDYITYDKCIFFKYEYLDVIIYMYYTFKGKICLFKKLGPFYIAGYNMK